MPSPTNSKTAPHQPCCQARDRYAVNGYPTESQYVLAPTDDPLALKTALTNALGVRAVVRKQRTLYLVGQTRIHFDRVENLGEFIELEVVLTPGQTFAEGVEIAAKLMRQLEINEQDLVESAYVDLLEDRGDI